MSKVYLVSSGEYSAYTVRYVCTTPQLAARYIKFIDDRAYIEEFDLMEDFQIPAKVELRAWVEIDKKGNLLNEGCDTEWREPWPDHGGIIASTSRRYEKGDPPEGVLNYKLAFPHEKGESKEIALKIARDQLAERKAMEKGV